MNARFLHAWTLSGVGIGLLAGCRPSVPPEPIHTVSWYVSHPTARTDKQKECAEDAARQATPNCMNAQEAWHQVNLKPNANSFADGLEFK